MIKFVCFYLCVLIVSGFLYDNPCDVFPKYSGGISNFNNFTTTVNVPAKCKNGTFRWDYPQGHAMLHFQNMHGMEIKICIKDSLGGTFFNVTDKATNERLATFDYENWSCTEQSSAKDILIQVDAPIMRIYVAAIEYKVFS
ncbi:uncharacterized protein LOC132750184 [Ruditapes philippinarum]|uniref:uncharacterized protein LOC132750184 n=1 Tax=Ruditapes philippinarum TaxID=129788 RepID=UPI00295A8DDE|nr:uncharacterized protein LOC132750184 [Ruditapes philippinarum]